MNTIYIAQAFDYEVKKSRETGRLKAEQPFQFKTAEEAISKAQRLAEKKAGAVAIEQQYDPESGEAGDFRVLTQFGSLPDGLIEQ